MGILTTLGFIAATTAVSKAASKAAEAEKQAEERRIEAEKVKKIAEQQEMTKRALAIEAEKTRRTIAMQEAARQKMALQQEAARQRMVLQQEAERQRQLANQQAIERHRKEMEKIRQLRIEHPIDYTCPCCTAKRIIDRRAGKITCEYCGFVQPLESFHIFVPELDMPRGQGNTQQPVNNINKPTTKSKVNTYALLSAILSAVALITAGMFFFPELAGIVLGIAALRQPAEKRDSTDNLLAIIGISVSAGAALIFFVYVMFNMSSYGNHSSGLYTTTSALQIMLG